LPWRDAARRRATATRAATRRSARRGRRREHVGRHRRHFDLQVDAVEQRAAQPASVASDLVRRAAAGRPRIAEVAAGAGVHRRHELEAGRKVGPGAGARDGEPAGLERLPQCLEGGARELRKLVEEEHPVVRQRGLPGAWRRAAADERGRRGAVVRRPERAKAPARVVEGAGRAPDRRRLERGIVVEWRQQPGQASRQHRLAAARRAGHQQRVPAGGGDLEGALGRCLSLHVGQVWKRPCGAPCRRLDADQRRSVRGIAGQQRPDDIEQVASAVHRHAVDEGGLPRALERQHEPARAAAGTSRAPAGEPHGDGAAHRPDLAAEGELAGIGMESDALGIELAVGSEDADGDRQVEAARLLRQVGGGEVDGHPAVVRKAEPAREERGAHPLAGLLDLGLGETDEREGRQAVGQMHLDGHLRRIEPAQRAAHDGGEAHGSILRASDDGLHPEAGAP
jgi:hypothetical protein